MKTIASTYDRVTYERPVETHVSQDLTRIFDRCSQRTTRNMTKKAPANGSDRANDSTKLSAATGYIVETARFVILFPLAQPGQLISQSLKWFSSVAGYPPMHLYSNNLYQSILHERGSIIRGHFHLPVRQAAYRQRERALAASERTGTSVPREQREKEKDRKRGRSRQKSTGHYECYSGGSRGASKSAH